MLGEDLVSKLKAKNTPGVFVQGLLVYSGAGDEVLFERLLDADTVARIEKFCEERGVSLIAYSGDRIVSPPACSDVVRRPHRRLEQRSPKYL